MNNSTLSGNYIQYLNGGGIYNSGTLTVSNSTLSGSSGPNGGILNNGGALTIKNSIVANSSFGRELCRNHGFPRLQPSR